MPVKIRPPKQIIAPGEIANVFARPTVGGKQPYWPDK
jgi:hypothetical protein